MAVEFQQLSRLSPRKALAQLLPLLLALACGSTAAQGVVLSGRMGERALLVIDGRPLTVGPGQTVAGVTLLRWAGDDAEVRRDGATWLLRPGATPARTGAAAPASGGREIVIAAGPGGHFSVGGSINGRAVRFMVDTGATLVSLSADDAVRLGLDMTGARRALTQTANGDIAVQLVTLSRVRVGDVELANVAAAVLPVPMPVVLLGNSFLSRLQMRRENDIMRLELR